MLLVVDASAAVKAFVSENHSSKAQQLFSRSAVVMMPAHALAEIAEIMTRKLLAGQIDRRQIDFALDVLRRSSGLIALDALLERAIAISLETAASVYDTLYIAGAELLHCKLVTADERLIRQVSGTSYFDRLLSLADVNFEMS